MNKARRSFLAVFVPGAAIAGAALLTADARQSQSRPTRPPVPDPNPGPPKLQDQQPKPPDLPDPAEMTPSERKALLADDQKEIKKEVDALLSLVQDLKSQTEKMDSTTTLSVGFVQKTEEIEKLARKIRGLARG
jgi:hypothetical protein